MKITETILSPKLNNFTLVRLVLATSVIYSHSWGFVTGRHDIDGLTPWLGAGLATYAVDGFFFLSGFLVYASLGRLGSSFQFLGARLTRLWPALAFSVLLVVVGGAFVTTSTGLAYLEGPTLKFILGNLTFVKGFYTLTGVDCDGGPCNVNGSLWTLPMEARCYLILALLGVAGLASPKNMVRFVYPLTLLMVIAWDFSGFRDALGHHLRPGLIYFITIFDRLWPLFALGTAAYIFRDRIRLSWIVLGALLAINLACQHSPVFAQVRAVFIGYAVLCCGLLAAEKKAISGSWPDYSYGMYIYAFPTMMLLHESLPHLGSVLLFSITAVSTAPIAAVSWHMIEKPALDTYRARFKRRSPRPDAAVATGAGNSEASKDEHAADWAAGKIGEPDPVGEIGFVAGHLDEPPLAVESPVGASRSWARGSNRRPPRG
jgi:peptidoglycan/LPS O-acetylase OafA/YrhL